jgi:hypothetical protein
MSFSTGRDDVVLCCFAPDATYRMQLVRPTLDPITSTSCLPLVQVAFTSRFHMPTCLRFQCHRSAFSSLLFIELRPYFRRCTPQRVSPASSPLDIVDSISDAGRFHISVFRLTDLPTVTTLQCLTPLRANRFHFFPFLHLFSNLTLRRELRQVTT